MSNSCICDEDSAPEEIIERVDRVERPGVERLGVERLDRVERVKVLEISDEALLVLKRMQERRVTSSGSSSSTEPASTDLPSPEAVLTTEQRLHYLRLALAAPEITDRLKKKHLQKRIETARDSSEGSKDSTDSTSSSRGHGALLCLVWAVGLIEGLGILALPAVALPLISDLGLSLQNLMAVVLAQAISQALAMPIWAALADANAANRKTLLALGMFSNGGLTCSFAAANAFVPLILLGVLNAIAMASLRSVSLGLLAEVTSEQYRGRIFGCFSLAKHLGIALGCFANPWLCSQSFFGFEGWRIAILASGLLSMLLSLFVALTMKEPPREARLTDMEPGVRAELWRLARYCRFPSFLLIVFAGCLKCASWTVMGYHILIVDAVGLAHQEVTLRGLGQVSAACGALFGGLLADLMARCLPSHGRILVAQASVALILPMSFFAMKASPNTGWELLYQASFTSGIGFTSTWITGACLPIVVDLAPTGRKSGIIAWQMALEQVFSVAAACIIGVSAPKIAGLELPGVQTALSLAVQQIVVDNDPQKSSEDIIGLTRREGFAMAVFAMMALFWGLALCCYSLLHWSYPRDWYRAKQMRIGEAEKFWTLPSQV